MSENTVSENTLSENAVSENNMSEKKESEKNMSNTLELCDFTSAKASESWNVVTDKVMGGLSEGAVSAESNEATIFSGTISLENSGGFSSIRYANDLTNLQEYTGFKISIQGDGATYQLRAHTKTAERGNAFKLDIQTKSDTWQEIELPFDDFILSEHGRLNPEAGKVNPADINQISLLIAGGHSGPFKLKIKTIQAYR